MPDGELIPVFTVARLLEERLVESGARVEPFSDGKVSVQSDQIKIYDIQDYDFYRVIEKLTPLASVIAKDFQGKTLLFIAPEKPLNIGIEAQLYRSDGGVIVRVLKGFDIIRLEGVFRITVMVTEAP